MAGPSHFSYDVFLCHSSTDKSVVRELAERLRKARMRVWLDEWIIRPGDPISVKIEEGLEQSALLLFCMSAHAFGSEWVTLERHTAIFRDPLNRERRLLPLRIDDAPIKAMLQGISYIDWRPGADRVREWGRLLEACGVDQAQAIEINREALQQGLIDVSQSYLSHKQEQTVQENFIALLICIDYSGEANPRGGDILSISAEIHTQGEHEILSLDQREEINNLSRVLRQHVVSGCKAANHLPGSPDLLVEIFINEELLWKIDFGSPPYDFLRDRPSVFRSLTRARDHKEECQNSLSQRWKAVLGLDSCIQSRMTPHIIIAKSSRQWEDLRFTMKRWEFAAYAVISDITAKDRNIERFWEILRIVSTPPLAIFWPRHSRKCKHWTNRLDFLRNLLKLSTEAEDQDTMFTTKGDCFQLTKIAIEPQINEDFLYDVARRFTQCSSDGAILMMECHDRWPRLVLQRSDLKQDSTLRLRSS